MRQQARRAIATWAAPFSLCERYKSVKTGLCRGVNNAVVLSWRVSPGAALHCSDMRPGWQVEGLVGEFACTIAGLLRPDDCCTAVPCPHRWLVSAGRVRSWPPCMCAPAIVCMEQVCVTALS